MKNEHEHSQFKFGIHKKINVNDTIYGAYSYICMVLLFMTRGDDEYF